jgi:hypothetical protein
MPSAKKKDEPEVTKPKRQTKTKPAVETAGEEDVKKRGRKSRGGKLILREPLLETAPPVMQNVILHLKCSLKDLEEHHVRINRQIKDPHQYDPNIPPEIMAYDSFQPFGLYNEIDNVEIKTVVSAASSSSVIAAAVTAPSLSTHEYAPVAYAGICKKCNETMFPSSSMTKTVTNRTEEECDLTELQGKIKDLKVAYYKGDVDLSRRSCCFWCTYDFENSPFFIPRHEWVDTVMVYGYFCSPECAVAFLFKENIDDHTKFERYHYLNKMYGVCSDYGTTRNMEGIRPAPNPFYLLERFMGTLTISEYRKWSRTQPYSLVVIDKPMTRVLPELHADNDSGGSSYKIKKVERSKK